MITVPMRIATTSAIPMTVASSGEVVGAVLGVEYKVSPDSPYHGEYEVIPGDEVQTLQTAGKVMLHNVVVEKIPSNYGRITYNGSTLTVS